MVLEFGLLKTGLFQESENSGVGLGGDVQQTIIKIINDSKTHFILVFDEGATVGGCLLVHNAKNWTLLNSTATRVTSDAGLTWANATTDVTGIIIGIVCRANKALGIGFTNSTTSSVYTTNRGVDWTAATTVPANWTGALCCDFPTATLAVAGLDRGTATRSIMRSTDGGVIWTVVTSGPSTTDTVAISMLDATTGYAVDSSNNIWKTTNGGVDWTDTTHNVTYISTISSLNHTMKTISATRVIYSTSVRNVEYYNNAEGTIMEKFTLNKGDAITASDFASNFVKGTSGFYYKAHGYSLTGAGSGRTFRVLLFRSVDGGVTWTARDIAVPSTQNDISVTGRGCDTQLSEYEDSKFVIHIGLGLMVLVDET